ncbi:hypothetical protein LSTR_LSTR015706 [Laodelphax striatellus]|uniref:Uncharacterized protein n=1 Tax=Laodelphax striatellus TaxID=195883 RepID=A0A482XJT5_LAOST|nr:hypothetical protein LSTR_LSTR015706 [Laodelphax striatellus]
MAGQGIPEPAAAKQPSDYRNSDLVSRLLAATPPYLYNMPLLPNSFFFSEMLRSFVQAKSAASASSQGHATTPTASRRGRKRTWKDTTSSRLHHNHHQQQPLNIHPETNNNNVIREPIDKPLELTTGSRSTPPPPQPTNPPTPPPNTLLPDQIPPPPPIWYPYHPPPYTATAPFDPLHFFIDLRVSGHICDLTKNSREQESGNNPSVEPLDLQTDQKVSGNVKTSEQMGEQMSLFKPSRKHMSAFAVPKPRDTLPSTTYGMDAAKLRKLNDVDGENNNQPKPVSTNYVLQNLSKIYKELECKSKKEDGFKNEDEVLEVKEDVGKEGEEKLSDKEKNAKDLRALIGLELVKDYVSFEGKRYPKGQDSRAFMNKDSFIS